MIIGIHQPQYMPWLGYFDKMARSDVFVLLDTVQYKKNEWQNRNRIKTPTGWQWLTVPVTYRYPEKICDVRINNREDWRRKQQATLRTYYGRAPHWRDYAPFLDGVLRGDWEFIADLNVFLVKELAGLLKIETPVLKASDLPEMPLDPDERLIAVARHCNCDEYLAGAGGMAYMNQAKYADAGITLRFQEYRHPVYPQLNGPFQDYLSVLDLLFNCGPESSAIIRGA